MRHGLRQLQEAGEAGCGDQVAGIGLERSDGQVTLSSEDAGRGGDFDTVADGCSGGVAFEEADTVGGDAGLSIGTSHGFGLTFTVGREQALAAAIIGEADGADHAVDFILRCYVAETFEDNRDRAFGRHESVGPLDEGARASGGAERLQRFEADMEDQVVGSIDRADEADVDLAGLEFSAGDLDGVERRGAGGVEGEDRAGRADGLRENMDGKAGIERVGGGAC